MLKEKPELSAEEISAAFADWNVSGKEISVTKKSTFANGIGFSPKFVEKLFSDPEPKLLGEVFKTEENRYIVTKITKHTAADTAAFESSKANLKASLANAKKAQIYEAYVEKLRADARIEINREFLKLFEGGDK